MGTRLLEGDIDEVHDVKLVVKRGEVPLRIDVPSASAKGTSRASNGVVFWMHGGGWIFGPLGAHDTISKDLATASGMVVVSVGYRLGGQVSRFHTGLSSSGAVGEEEHLGLRG